MSTAMIGQAMDPPGAARILAAALDAGEGLGAFTRLALVAGARWSELLGIRWPDLEWPTGPQEAGTLQIACRDGGKTPFAHREVALDPATMALLAEWRDVRSSTLAAFGAELDEQGHVFAAESPMQVFRSPRATMAHERNTVRRG